ncbi:hypothetical protein EO081_04035 [Sphingomonas desiccabilis]|uniref:Uncharacterized protein n=2 Tax=Sphingomonas desiccabilis TaxID=429134 RepID=A0A4V1QPS7_9SPHN|nr:hypothetical protein EO081_04035 [Sphingomonas desiccabilis]
MIEQGAPEAEIDTYVASEGVSAEDLRDARMDAGDEQAYAALAADPRTTAADLKGFVKQRGFSLNDADIDAFMAARQQGSKVGRKVVYEGEAHPPVSLAQNLGAAAGKFADAILPGVAGLDRGVHKVTANAAQALLGNEEFDPSAAFQQGKDEQDFSQSLFDAQHPNASTAASAAGLVGSLLLPEARVLRGSGMLPGMGNAALTAGGYGALSGALNDSGGGRVENAILGGVAGAGLGAAAAPAFRGAAAIGSAARRNVPGVDATARFLENVPRRFRNQPLAQPGDAAAAQGERILADELPQGTIATGMGTGGAQATPQAIEAEVARRAAMNVPAMPVDVSEKGRRITGWALQGNGPMATRARNMLLQRQAAQGSRIRGHLAEELGPAVDPVQAVDQINRRASAASGPGYQAAYAQPMVLTPEIEGIMRTPAFQDALPQALRNIRNAQRDPVELGFRLDRDGNIAGTRTLTVEGFDQVIRAMRDAGQAAMDTSGFRPRNTTNSVHINDRVRDLRGHLADQNEAYRDVTANYADEMALRDALGAGQEVSKLTGPEIAGQMRDMPQHAQEAWMTGAQTALADEATQAGLKPTANVAQRTRQSLGMSGAGAHASMGDQAKQQALEAMSGRPGLMNRLADRLEAEDQGFKAFHEAFGNSKTQPRQAMDEALSGQALQVAGRAARGDIIGAVASVLFQGNPRGTLRFKQDVQDRISELMTATGAADVQTAMRAIARRAQQDAAFADALNRAGIKPSKIAAILAASQDTSPTSTSEGEDEPLMPPVYTRANQ